MPHLTMHTKHAYKKPSPFSTTRQPGQICILMIIILFLRLLIILMSIMTPFIDTHLACPFTKIYIHLLCLDRKHILSLILYIVPPYNHHLHRTTVTYIPLINLHPLPVHSFIRSNFYCTYLVLTYQLAVATTNTLSIN